MKCPNHKCQRAISVEATSCVCGWRASAAPVEPDRNYIEPPAKRYQPTAEQRQILRDFITRTPNTGPWWTVERVRNQAQVDHIIRQANHFGQGSVAGEFYDQCRKAGIIVDCRYVQRQREPGED